MLIEENIKLVNQIASKIKNAQKAKILVLRREGSLGDSILTRGVYSSLKKFNQNIKISVFCLKPAVAFLKLLPEIDDIYYIGLSKLRKHRCWLSFLFYGLYFRLKNFTCIIDDNPYDAKNWKFFTWLIGKNKILQSNKPFNYEKILNVLGVAYYETTLPINDIAKQKLSKFMTENKISKYIVFNCFGSIKERTFNANTFNLLVSKIRELNINLPIIFPYQSNKNEVLNLYKANKDKNIFYYKTSNLSDLFAVIGDIKNYLTITVDTSVVHIAKVFDKNSIIFYQNVVGCPHNNKYAKQILSSGKDDVNYFSMQEFTDDLKFYFK